MTPALMLGVSHEVGYVDAAWSLPHPGGALVLYSDGVTEAMNEDFEQFGETRLLETLAGCDRNGASAIVSALQQAVVAFRGRQVQSDDLTLLVCQRQKA
jgi:phosphoserine phosphatase RsbU/P